MKLFFVFVHACRIAKTSDHKSNEFEMLREINFIIIWLLISNIFS